MVALKGYTLIIRNILKFVNMKKVPIFYVFCMFFAILSKNLPFLSFLPMKTSPFRPSFPKPEQFQRKIQPFPIIRQKQTDFYAIIHYALIHTLAPGWKGKKMPDIDTEILRLFHLLNAEQKREIISLALPVLAAEQEETSSDPPTAAS